MVGKSVNPKCGNRHDNSVLFHAAGALSQNEGGAGASSFYFLEFSARRSAGIILADFLPLLGQPVLRLR